MMTIDQQKRTDAQKLLNCLVKSQKLMRKEFNSLSGIKVIGLRDDIQLLSLASWCELLNIQYTRTDWDGNEYCETNWDIIYFWYKGFKFFELVAKEED